MLNDAKVEKVRCEADHAVVEVDHKGRSVEIETELVLVSVGRKAVVPQGFPGEINQRGYIVVNEKFQTAVPNIYAQATSSGIQLAHLAFKGMGQNMFNSLPEMNGLCQVVYTSPGLHLSA